MSISFYGIKKWIALLVIVAIAGGGFYGIRYWKEKHDTPQASHQGAQSPKVEKVKQTVNVDYYVEYKLERDRIRDERKEMLREIVNNPDSDLETRKQAQAEIIAISQMIEKEMVVENLVKAKGFEDAIVFMDANAAQVVVKAKTLDEQELVQISDIVCRNTSILPEKVTIIPKK